MPYCHPGGVHLNTVAVNTEGVREVLGVAIGPSEAEPFRTGFLRSLTRRGLRGVKLVISDAHEGLKVNQDSRLVHHVRGRDPVAAVRGRLALTHVVYVFAMNIPSVIASVPPIPCNGWRPCAKFPRTS